jgi:branched-chain amino acid transport system substrate-binding protein
MVVGPLCAGCGQRPAVPILVGHPAPSSRYDPTSGQQARRGILLAAEEINREGEGLFGRRLKVLHPECAPDPESVRAAAVRLTAIDKVSALIGGLDPSQADALAQVAEAAKAPLVAPAGRTKAARHFVFHPAISPVQQGEILARFARETPQSRVGVLVGARDGAANFSRSLAAAFVREHRKSGGHMAGEWDFETPAQLKEMAERLTAERTDCILLAGTHGDLAELGKLDVKQMPVFFGGPDGALPVLAATSQMTRVYIATAFLPAVPQAADFVLKFEQRFGEKPDVHAALAYDSARLLIDGLRRAGTSEGPKIRDALAGIKQFDSVTGPLTLTDEWARRLTFLVQVENGEAKMVKTVPAEE